LSENPNFIDPHFCPQSLLLGIELIHYDYIFKMENMQEFSDWFQMQGLSLKTYQKHSTSASRKEIISLENCK
jgi:hypothetical protein